MYLLECSTMRVLLESAMGNIPDRGIERVMYSRPRASRRPPLLKVNVGRAKRTGRAINMWSVSQNG